MWYRVWQLWQVLIAKPLKAAEWQAIEAVLTAEELELFGYFSLNDQLHSYRVMQDLLARKWNDSQLLTAALLHDIGKTKVKLTLIDRSLAVLLKKLFPSRTTEWGMGEAVGWKRPFVVKAQHPEWGAQMVEAIGTDKTAVWLIRHHQDKLEGETAVNEYDQLLQHLQWADDRN